MSNVIYRLAVVLLSVLGIVALGVSVLSAWDGAWLPVLVLLPGVIAYVWSIWRRPAR